MLTKVVSPEELVAGIPRNLKAIIVLRITDDGLANVQWCDMPIDQLCFLARVLDQTINERINTIVLSKK